MYSPKTPGYPAFLSKLLRLGNPDRPVERLTSQSYKDPELVIVKMVIG